MNKSLNYGQDIIGEFLKSISYEKILDIGAGHGRDLMIAKRINPMAELFAVDYDKSNMELLSSKGIKSFQIDLEKEMIPFEDETVDVVIANQVVEHTKEIFWIFHEVCRVLKQDQYFIIGIPNLAALHNRLMLLFGQQPACIRAKSAHIRGFTKTDMIKFAKIGGLKLVKRRGSNFYPFSPWFAKPLSKILPSLSVCIFFLFKKERTYQGEFLEFPVKEKLATNFFIGDSRGDK